MRLHFLHIYYIWPADEAVWHSLMDAAPKAGVRKWERWKAPRVGLPGSRCHHLFQLALQHVSMHQDQCQCGSMQHVRHHDLRHTLMKKLVPLVRAINPEHMP